MTMQLSREPERARHWVINILHVMVLVLALFLVIFISIDTFKNIAFYKQPEFMKLQFWICILFLFDFFLELMLAKRKWKYLWTHLLFLLVSIPYVSIIEYLGITFTPKVGYLLRFVPLVRGGYAMAIVVGWFTYNKATSLFVTYLTTLLATIYFGSMVFFVFERNINPLVHTYYDALWWAFMDVTTVGSNIIAVTTVGRVLSVLLAALGMMMFPIFTVYVTSLIKNYNYTGRSIIKAPAEESPTPAANPGQTPASGPTEPTPSEPAPKT